MDVVHFVLRTAIGLVCLWAGLSKILGFPAFRASLATLGMTPRRSSTGIALGIVATELVVSVAMLADVVVPLASLGAATLFMAFAGGAAIAIRRGRSAPCHCFGGADGDVASWTTVVRAITLTVGSVALLVASTTSPGPVSPELAPPSLTIALALVVIARYSSLIPLTNRFFRSPPPVAIPATRRVSFRHRPLDSSLRQPLPPGRPRSSLSMIEPRGVEAIDLHD